MSIHNKRSSAAIAAAPTTDEIRRIWSGERRFGAGTADKYLICIQQFRTYCSQLGLIEREELTLEGANRFIGWYARRRSRPRRSHQNFRSALRSLARVYHRMGVAPPDWQPPRAVQPPPSPLFAEYDAYLVQHLGLAERTIHKQLSHLSKFYNYLVRAGKEWYSIQLTDVDAFLVGCSTQYSRSYVSNIASTVRCFYRFLHWSGKNPIDISEAIIAPIQRPFERPRRALPWEDVQRLLNAVDRSTPVGLRDYAILLMLSTYGLGAAEVNRLQFQAIDWNANTLAVYRPKTGVSFTLPLLPPISEALAHYLRYGRPVDTPTRHIFVQMQVPFEPYVRSSAIGHIVAKHARKAGINAPSLGSHVLRHSHAGRQIDLGTRPQVLSELLGHSDPESVSAYVRIATDSLREIALPVPA
ncbi:tyrosine-type recombinase/integrase [Mesorhizobium japonicum]|uniref:Integrase/recombinase n=1 Tax=Mesorhizobium japonicum (strain LMG 29417 / CECT 9101 / MAFF 303099) TaxID=266835 RepID=Q981K9_RHILO|nr:tyrosine-type recombinase/integrase [Mesorhizobium japonicum]BAB54700.1 integrase/recombinase [Mesorhizobium japonicum MAFF 303099]